MPFKRLSIFRRLSYASKSTPRSKPETALAERNRAMAGGLRFDHFVRLFAGDSQRFDQSPFLDA